MHELMTLSLDHATTMYIAHTLTTIHNKKDQHFFIDACIAVNNCEYHKYIRMNFRTSRALKCQEHLDMNMHVDHHMRSHAATGHASNDWMNH